MKKLTVFVLLGGLSQAAAAQDHKNPLEMMDSDGNGSVSFAEFQALGPNLGLRMDSDDDGFIALDEFLSQRPGRRPPPDAQHSADDAAHASREERREQFMARMTAQFQEMDLDGDDLLSPLELQEAQFLRMDRDNNGALDSEELRPSRGKGPRENRGAKQQRSSHSQ
ncbi:MAG: Ca2+-binding EF-hand superfamily protein [Pseudohongiellaceae bacterium]|jgi:Ca2+-binding EF-hand superfamily protein